MFGKTEDLIIILLIILVLFGAKKIPGLAKSIGQAAREVRKGFSSDSDTTTMTKDETKPEEKPSQASEQAN